MSDIFGPDTKLYRQERDLAKRIISGRDILSPVYDNSKLISLYQESLGGQLKDNLGIDFFDIFSDDMIVPFDFVDIPREDFLVPVTNKRKIRDYRSEYRKFISRPDFFYVGIENGNAHLFPVDLKSSDSRGISQVSMMNTAMLYHHSNYMQYVVSHLKNKQDLNIIFENGFFLFGDDTNDASKDGLERYLQDYLLGSIQRRDGDNERLGIRFVDGKPSLAAGLERIFSTDMDYEATAIDEARMISYFSFVKARIGPTTTYPNMISSINGFNGGRKPIFRLDFDPTSHIRTYNPEVELIEGEIERIYQMSPEDLFNHFPSVNLSFNERRLDKLNIELEAKRRDRNFRIQKRVEEAIGGNGSNRDSRLYANNLNRLDKGIEALESKVRDVKMDVLKSREEAHNSKPQKGSSEWYKEALDTRKELVSKRFEELERQKKTELKWKKKDLKLTQGLLDFHVMSLINDDFTLSSDPYFKLPQELYLQLHPYNLMRVLLYNSYRIKD